MSGRRKAILKINEILNAKILVVSQRRIIAVVVAH